MHSQCPRLHIAVAFAINTAVCGETNLGRLAPHSDALATRSLRPATPCSVADSGNIRTSVVSRQKACGGMEEACKEVINITLTQFLTLGGQLTPLTARLSHRRRIAVNLEQTHSAVRRELHYLNLLCICCRLGWLGSRVVGVLDSGAEGPAFKSQPQLCPVTVLGKLFTSIVPLFTKQRN